MRQAAGRFNGALLGSGEKSGMGLAAGRPCSLCNNPSSGRSAPFLVPGAVGLLAAGHPDDRNEQTKQKGPADQGSRDHDSGRQAHRGPSFFSSFSVRLAAPSGFGLSATVSHNYPFHTCGQACGKAPFEASQTGAGSLISPTNSGAVRGPAIAVHKSEKSPKYRARCAVDKCIKSCIESAGARLH